MPVQLSYPGVYIQEIPGGSRAITGVATSICAFVGRALRGPVNQPIEISSYGDFERRFGGLWRQSGLGYAVRDYYLNGGQTAIIVRLAANNAKTANFGTGWLPIEAAGPGEWANKPDKKLTATIDHPTQADAAEIAEAQGVDKDQLFHLFLVDEDSGVEEQFLNVTVVDGPRRVESVLTSSTLVAVTTQAPLTARPTKETKTATGGADGDALKKADYVGTNFQRDKKGLYALEKADLFTLLCMPPSGPDGDLDDALWAEALGFCKERRAFLLVDPPSAKTADNVKTWLAGSGLTGTPARNGAMYFPRIRRADPLRDGAVSDFVPCGAVAGTIARTDTERGVWKAPAGIDAALLGADPTLPLNDSDSGKLNPVGINCLRTFRGTGCVVWGARTLRGSDSLADEYKYVPVRRLALYLEETLYRGTQWVVFEPNDEPLWSQIRMSVGAFMQDLFRQGAFAGVTPREAYFVRCDRETTTPYDTDRGIVNILVGFAPLKPAEFVVISIQQKSASATT